MSLPNLAVSLEQNVDPMSDFELWLDQYKDSYRIMNRICSSSKGNRYSFQLITGVHLEDMEEKEVYRFSLDLKRASGDMFLEGPSLCIDSNQKNLITFMLVMLEKHYLETNGVFDIPFSFQGYLKNDKPAGMKSYRAACTIFDATDVVQDDYLQSVMQQEALCYQNQVNDQLLIRNFYESAKEETVTIDNQFFDSFDKSNDSYARVLKFDAYKKKR